METEVEEISLDKLESAAEMLKAIAHPIRMAIVHYLQEDEKTVTDIYEHVDIEQAVASHHLAILKNKGVLNAHRDGKNVLYSLSHVRLLQIIDCIEKCQPKLGTK